MITGELKNRIDALWDIFAAGGLVNPLRKPLSLSRECCSLPSTTFSKRMSHTIRNFISVVTTLHRNTGQFPWRRPSSFCSVRAISSPPAPLDRLCCYIFFGYRKVVCLCAPFSGQCLNYNVSNFHLLLPQIMQADKPTPQLGAGAIYYILKIRKPLI